MPFAKHVPLSVSLILGGLVFMVSLFLLKEIKITTLRGGSTSGGSGISIRSRLESNRLLDQQIQVVDSSTGALFEGHAFRSFSYPRQFQNYKVPAATKPRTKPSQNDKDSSCTQWSVVTTIFEPSEAIHRAASLPDWCIVIVADTKTPTDLYQQQFQNNPRVHFLSVQQQEEAAAASQQHNSNPLKDFIQQTPWKHFARKNIGYLYAIQHGAQLMFDFDDDNLVNDFTNNIDTNRAVPPTNNATHLEHVRIITAKAKTTTTPNDANDGSNPNNSPVSLNHHPLMGATLDTSWARGFPLRHIQDETTHGHVMVNNAVIELSKIGVMQICANENPDIDAIHRLVKPLPMNFDATQTPILLVPNKAGFAPYNAQATIHTYHAFFALLLPSTVPGRVSDIWRSYFAQAIFRNLDLALAFLPPNVRQDRNPHNYLADFTAEWDLYTKAEKLVEFLSQWKYNTSSTTSTTSTSSIASVPEQMEALWIDLYERGYIEVDDVLRLQMWLQTLIKIQYEFPNIVPPTTTTNA